MLTDQDLLKLNQRGLIPGPEETEEQFVKRLNFAHEGGLSPVDWQKAQTTTHKLFEFTPDWIHAFYEKKGLPFWQGAVAWIGETPSIQLHPRLKKGKLFGLYDLGEILAHEAVHAARCAFSEPRFEEHFAYLTSRSPLRRWLGPLFRTAKESSLFLLLLGIALLSNLLSPLLPPLIFLCAFGALIARLTYAHRTLQRCRKNLEALLKKSALPMLLRLTDKEISLFAHASSEEIRKYAERERQHSLRWKMLNIAYL